MTHEDQEKHRVQISRTAERINQKEQFMMGSRRVIVLLVVWLALGCILLHQSEAAILAQRSRRRRKSNRSKNSFVPSTSNEEVESLAWVNCDLES